MALFREAVHLGHVPREDVFAYTPTVSPSVHHEWGTGAILYWVSTRFGSGGILFLKYLLAGATGVLAFACARRRGASLAVLAPLTPVAVFGSLIGFSTIRAQVITILFIVLLLWFLALDRDGRRAWIPPWFVLFLIWVNVHAGFVVGVAFYFAHAFEEAVRRRPVKHLVFAALGFLPLVFVNPYGAEFVPYVWKAIRLDRSLVAEWAPVWEGSPVALGVFVFSIVIASYGVFRNGFKGASGIAILLLATYAGFRHVRHGSIFAAAWLVIVPAWIETTPLGEALRQWWRRHVRLNRLIYGGMAAACLVGILARRPWILPLPANPGDHPKITYPVGAVDYLRESGFRGNVWVPFTTGAFLLWKLHPEVLVSFDGRFEVAYPPEALAENVDFFDAKPGWQDVLDRYDTDLVLAPTWEAVCDAMLAEGEWSPVYRDDAYVLFARPGLELAGPVDRRGETLRGTFP